MTEVTVTDDISGDPKIARVKALATTNATLVKVGRGNLFGLMLLSTAAAATQVFLKFHDTATIPVPGTTPVLFTIPVVSTTTLAGFVQDAFDFGIPFFNGIGYSITGLVADSDATAVAADAIHGFILWK